MSIIKRLLPDIAASRSARNVALLLIVNVVNLAVALGTLPFLTRALHPEAFGKYAIYTAVAQYASLFVDWGFTLAGSGRRLRGGPIRRW